MSAAASPIEASPRAIQRDGDEWIATPRFDLFFFTLSPLAVLPLVALGLYVNPRFALLFFLLSFPHYLSTTSFFFWDDLQPRYRAQRVAFIGGPLFIAVAFCALLAAGLPRIIQVTIFLWNVFHVSRQSTGILSIYRHRAGVNDPSQRTAANLAILSSNLLLSFWNIDTFDAFDPLRRIRSDWSHWLRYGLGALALIALINLGVALHRRIRSGGNVTLAEGAFLTTSLTLFHPFLWMRNSSGATAVMLLPHYVQYLGIVWLMNRRRFAAADSGERTRVMARISSSTPLLLASLAAVGFVTIAFSLASHRSGHPLIFESFYLLVALEHFYLAGLVWAFRDPSVRKAFGPFLTSYRSAAVEAS